MSDETPHLLIVEAPYYEHISEYLIEGVLFAIEGQATYDSVKVAGALEIPAAISLYAETQKYDGFIALGCVIRGETTHYEIVSNESARAIMDLTINQKLAIGNGILTVENEDQALKRARMDELNKGGGAAAACLDMIAHKKNALSMTDNVVQSSDFLKTVNE